MITIHPDNNGNITVVEGSHVMLNCEATGIGKLKYRWSRKSGVLHDNVKNKKTQTLNIYNIKVNNSGQYYCKVSNNESSVLSMSVQVTVKSELIIKTLTMYIYSVPLSTI